MKRKPCFGLKRFRDKNNFLQLFNEMQSEGSGNCRSPRFTVHRLFEELMFEVA